MIPLCSHEPKFFRIFRVLRVNDYFHIEVEQRLVDLVMARDDWAGHFSVVEPGCVLLRALH
jgi:hypothetical protein